MPIINEMVQDYSKGNFRNQYHIRANCYDSKSLLLAMIDVELYFRDIENAYHKTIQMKSPKGILL
jgi:hypothetical protein